MEKNEEMLEFEFLDELEDKPEIPDKVNYENEYYEYFKDINEIIRNSEHPKWDIVKATIKEAARDTFEKISFGVTNNRFVNGFKDRWNEMASKGYAFKENTKEGIKAYINMSKYEYNKFTNREKPKLNFPKISLFEFSLKNTLMDMITDKYTPNLLNELLDTTVDLHSMRDKLDNTEISIMNNIDTFFRSMIDRASLYAYEEGDDIPFDKMKELNGIDFTKTDAAVVYKFLKENSASIVNVISYDESNHIPLNTSAYNRRLCKEAVYKMNDYVKALDKDNDKNINTASFKEESFKDKNNRVNQVR